MVLHRVHVAAGEGLVEFPIADLGALFAQLGLPDGQEAITAFIRQHKPLPEGIALADAPFWHPAQAALLRNAVAEDAEWAHLVDELDALMRH